MSYDITMFRLEEGRDLGEALDLLDEIECGADVPAPSAEDMARNRRVVAALMAFDASLECTEVSRGELQVSHLDDQVGMVMGLSARAVTINLAYCHGPEAAKQVWARVWAFVQIIQRETGFCAYDPQLDRVLDLTNDFDSVLETYGNTIRSTRRSVASFESDPSRPWWKFWQRG